MKIVQHVPGFVELDKPPESDEFSNYDELIQIPFIKRWVNNGNFKNLALSSAYTKELSLLIAIMKDSHWVLGYIDSPTVDWLPEWERDS